MAGRLGDRARRTPPQRTGLGLSLPGVADHNLRATLEMLRRDGRLSRQELSTLLGLSIPAISAIVRRLQQQGLVREARLPASGRYPATAFEIEADGALSIGIRGGPEGGEAVLLDLLGRERERIAAATPAGLGDAVARLRASSGPRLVGLGLCAGGEAARRAVEAAAEGLPVFAAPGPEAAVAAERHFGVGPVEGGIVLVIVEETVQAGLLLGSEPFGGVRGRAGRVGEMRTGADRRHLGENLAMPAFRAALGGRPAVVGGALAPEAAGFAQTAASHLLDAVVALAGFLAPGVILIGGDLPEEVVDAIIAAMEAERGDRTRRLMDAPWMPPVRRASFPGGGIAVGAALLPFKALLLPKETGA